MSVLVSEILGLFINTLTANDKYSLRNRENLPPRIHLQLSKKQKCFLNFLPHIRSPNQMLDILNKKMTLKGYVFSKLETAKDVFS